MRPSQNPPVFFDQAIGWSPTPEDPNLRLELVTHTLYGPQVAASLVGSPSTFLVSGLTMVRAGIERARRADSLDALINEHPEPLRNHLRAVIEASIALTEESDRLQKAAESEGQEQEDEPDGSEE